VPIYFIFDKKIIRRNDKTRKYVTV